MALDPTLELIDLTNAQAANLRDELVALLDNKSGLPNPTIRQLKRRLRMGINALEIQKDTDSVNALVEVANAARTAEHEGMKAILIHRESLVATDYGPD